MPRKHKQSKHGTLGIDDTDGAVALDLNEMKDINTPSIRHLFGDTNKLPPKQARQIERRYIPVWQIRDENYEDRDWVGLTKSTNISKGTFAINNLQPGEYKIQLFLPKELNYNIGTSFSGKMIGGIKALGLYGDEKEEAKERGLPNVYCDIHLQIQGKHYALVDIKNVLDLGLHSSFTKTFNVKEKDLPVTLNLRCESHTVVKRLKLQGTLYRRDFMQPKIINRVPQPPPSKQLNSQALSQEGKRILNEALNQTSTDAIVVEKRLLPSINMEKVVTNFYHEYAPNKINDVHVVINHFKGRDDDLIETLEAKYKVKFDKYGRATKI